MSRIAAFAFFCVFLSAISTAAALKGIDVENPAVEVTPRISVLQGPSKGAALCDRVQVTGISRLELGKYASAYRVMVVPSVAMPERLHSKIQICLHRNASLELCQCHKDDWKNLRKGVLISIGSPYDDRYIDVKFDPGLSGSVTVTVEEDFQGMRLALLALGAILLFLAPVVSNWVPFYYSSSMAIGVCLVVIILLFQGMKLLPTGRKNIFYLTIYGSVVGAGSWLVRYFSMMVSSLLVSFGLSEEMHNPVSVFLFLGIVIAGAGLGYWLVRKYVIDEDGGVDVGVSQFVKWALRTVAAALIFQSTLDTPLAIAMLCCCLICYLIITSTRWHDAEEPLSLCTQSGNFWPMSTKQAHVKHKRAEFYTRPLKKDNQGTIWDSPKSSSPESPVKGVVHSFRRGKRRQQDSSLQSTRRSTSNTRDFTSTFHKNPDRKAYTKEEWENLTKECTRQAVAELTASPEFTDWVLNSAERMQIVPDDETEGSGSDSTDEQVIQSSNGFQLFKW